MRSAVWSWLPDGTVHQLSPVGEGSWMQACVHPDGDHAVFWGGLDDDPPRLWRGATSGGEPEPLTGVDSGARHGAYGLAGDRIVFSSDRASGARPGRMGDETPAGNPTTGHWNIFSMAVDGTDVRQITEGPHLDQRPALSPDGRTIAFVSDRGRFGLWLVPTDGGSPPRPLCPGLTLYRPCWSIDGGTLFCFHMGADRRQVGSVDLDDETFVRLDNDDRGNTHGPWADPRGDCLVVHSDRDGRWGLHELPLDGSPMRPLLPPGHERAICAHGTRARNGVLTFDGAAMTELTRH
jgi:Tol biopolymer transport system component